MAVKNIYLNFSSWWGTYFPVNPRNYQYFPGITSISRRPGKYEYYPPFCQLVGVNHLSLSVNTLLFCCKLFFLSSKTAKSQTVCLFHKKNAQSEMFMFVILPTLYANAILEWHRWNKSKLLCFVSCSCKTDLLQLLGRPKYTQGLKYAKNCQNTPKDPRNCISMLLFIIIFVLLLLLLFYVADFSWLMTCQVRRKQYFIQQKYM